MRILHLDTAMHWGAGQNQVRLLMRELRDRGFEQMCVTPAGSQLEARLRTEDLPVHGVARSTGPGFLFVRAVVRLARGVTIIHAHTSDALTAARWAGRIRAVPVVAACRELAPARLARWMEVDRAIAISETAREYLTTRGIDPARVRVIHSGIDADEVRRLPTMVPTLRDRLGFEPDRFIVGAVGSLHDFRNYRMVPQAAARLRDVGWVIVGDGPGLESIEAAISAHGVKENVRLIGNIADPRTALQELDVLVAPGRTEALGTRILEAMALDVPVVGGDDAGPAEILGPVHADAGASLVPPDDAGALAEVVLRLHRDPGLRQRVVASQRERLAAFSIERTGLETVAIYRELAETGE